MFHGQKDRLLQALKRLDRKREVPVQDIRAMFRDVLAGDQVVTALQTHGYAVRNGDVLTITEAGKRRAAA
ncbi:hypothetical protein [Arenimonas sp.]|uniref:hypothetical protein n=1 Tax=Arenimonas sp. TaxID=1872635 RepID=UPI0039E485FB